VKRSPIRQVGRVGKRRAAKRAVINPDLCERAGGTWEMNEFGHQHCTGHHCEFCGRAMDCDGAHSQGRGQCGDDTIENMIVACRACHDKYDNGPREVREAMRQRAREITGGKE